MYVLHIHSIPTEALDDSVNVDQELSGAYRLLLVAQDGPTREAVTNRSIEAGAFEKEVLKLTLMTSI